MYELFDTYRALGERYRELCTAMMEMRALRSEIGATQDLAQTAKLEAQYSRAYKSWREGYNAFTAALYHLERSHVDRQFVSR